MTVLLFTTLRDYNNARQLQWDKEGKLTALYFSNAMAGEAGEVCNVIKKFERQSLGLVGSRATIQQFADEIADVIIYADLLAAQMGVDLGTAVKEKFNRKSDELGLTIKIP